jgi:hypothetical protein
MNTRDDHLWVRRRFAAHLSGLLTAEGEEERFRFHLDACESCRGALQAIGEVRPEIGTEHHIPASLLARWDAARSNLRGVERSLVRQHLEECGECREELVLLGHTPELARAPDLEEGPEGSRPGTPDPTAAPSRELSRSSERANRGSNRLQLAFGAWAVIATAAAVLLLLFRPAPHGGGGAGMSGWPAPTLVLSQTRGAEGNTLFITEATRAIVLGIPGVREFPRDKAIRIELFSPDHRLVYSGVSLAGELPADHGLVLSGPGGAWSPGTYRLCVSPGAQDSSTEYTFELRIR